jgi:hypothetical protein
MLELKSILPVGKRKSSKKRGVKKMRNEGAF